jgi:hypothetical protein
MQNIFSKYIQIMFPFWEFFIIFVTDIRNNGANFCEKYSLTVLGKAF